MEKLRQKIGNGIHEKKTKKEEEYQPSSEGGTRSPPAMPHGLHNPKWPPGGPKMANGVWKGVYP